MQALKEKTKEEEKEEIAGKEKKKRKNKRMEAGKNKKESKEKNEIQAHMLLHKECFKNVAFLQIITPHLVQNIPCHYHQTSSFHFLQNHRRSLIVWPIVEAPQMTWQPTPSIFLWFWNSWGRCICQLKHYDETNKRQNK